MCSIYAADMNRQMTAITDPEVYYPVTTKESHKIQKTDKLIHVTNII